MKETVTRVPELTQEDYRDFYEEPCTLVGGSETWWYGSGIAPDQHPLAEHIPFDVCANCDSEDVRVIAARHVVHPYSGDTYWDYEIVCKDCRRYTQRLQSDQD